MNRRPWHVLRPRPSGTRGPARAGLAVLARRLLRDDRL